MIRAETAAQLIVILNQVDEQEDIEAKRISGSDVGSSVFETICALSNEPDLGGGTILLGVGKDKSSLFPFYNADGVSDPDKLSGDIQSACSSKFNTPLRVDIRSEMVDENVVLRIDVPELSKSNKPAYFQATGLPRGAFRRIGSSDVRCTDEDLSTFWIGQSHEPYDTRLVKDSDYSDIDPEAIELYRSARGDHAPDDESLLWSDEDLLYALGAIRKIEDRWRITIAGMLMFGRTASIRRSFPTIRVDYIRIPGNQWVADPESQYDSQDMQGPIIRLIPRVISAVLGDLPRTFVVSDGLSGQRTETPVLPFRVIREAVVNALMHRSYEGFSPVQIIRYANRLEIKNAGYSLKSQDRFAEAGSAIRNPTIAAMLHETRFAETKGSGIRIMQRMMNEHGLASPTFRSDRDNMEFSATFLFHHFLDQRDWQWLSGFASLNLAQEQMKALIFVREVGAIDNSTYRSLNGVDTLSASRALRALCQMKLLDDRGAGAAVHYVAGEAMVQRGIPLSSMPTIPDMRTLKSGSPAQGSTGIEDLPLNLRTRAQTARMQKKLNEGFARRLIFTLCQWKAMSVVEIAAILDKNKSYVSSRYIAPMVADGTLRYTIPEMPKHPEQRYSSGVMND